MAWRTTKTLAAAAIAGSLVPAIDAVPVHAMSDYRWSNRPLVVFAPSRGDARLRRQLQIVRANRGRFIERDMVVIVVAGGTVSMALGRGQRLGADALRRRYGVGRDAFRALLIGKDTGVKLSSSQPIDAGRLFGLIDAMPMRRQEMRRRR